MDKVDSTERVASARGEIGAACFCINRNTGEIADCNAAAAGLFGLEASSLRGAPWVEVIAGADGPDSTLLHVMRAGVRSALPPFIVRRPDGVELVVGGMLLPRDSATPDAVDLLLWRLLDEDGLGLAGALDPADTLAVLGVDQLRYDQHWGVEQTARLMMDIRTSLLEIIRAQDTVGMPTAASIIIILRDVDVDGALDISRALLSHLRRNHLGPDTGLVDARISIGLAQMGAGNTELSTLLAANNALLQVQCSSGTERIRATAIDDSKLLAGRVINNTGIFSDDLAAAMSSFQDGVDTPVAAPSTVKQMPLVQPIEKGIEGYVGDNMEGAVDQAIFLSQLDMPVAIIGPAGTGKMYVANIIHEGSGGAPEMLVSIDCREFRNRSEANARIGKELAKGEGKTLVFKSPQLMNAEAQLKLARQISSRTLADVSPPQYLPRVKLVALFPDSLEQLMRQGSLTVQLASVFGGYPINVPPIKDRKQAVLRWAHKILGQEGAVRGRDMKGFTPDAEQSMLLYDWPGNISEMRQCIFDALEKTDKDWLTPVDLGLFKGITSEGAPYLPEPRPFLAAAETEAVVEDPYIASAWEGLDVALGEAVFNLLELNSIKPLGAWMEDDIVLAVLDRYRDDMRKTAVFLHTKPRNISRWLPKIRSRDDERNSSGLWQEPRRLLREWVRESPQLEDSPLQELQGLLIAHVNKLCAHRSTADRARIMGVSTPTYLKRLREVEDGQNAL